MGKLEASKNQEASKRPARGQQDASKRPQIQGTPRNTETIEKQAFS